MGFAGMFDFFGELKRILVSLTEVASLVQHVNCDESSNAESCDMETEEPEIQVSYISSLNVSFFLFRCTILYFKGDILQKVDGYCNKCNV